MAVMLLCALLLCTRVTRAEAPPPTTEGSKLQYVVKATFFVSVAMLIFVFVRAAMTSEKDPPRQRSAIEAIDLALQRARALSASAQQTPPRPAKK